MNATGASDAQNYGMAVQANQEKMAEPAIRRLDPLIARHVGLSEPLEYEWVPLFNLSEKEQAEISKLRTETILMPLNDRAIDESEVRERLSEDDFSFGPLSPNWEPPEPEDDDLLQGGMPTVGGPDD